MAHIEDRRDEGKGWRVRYRAPDHRERSKSFARKVDAERFLISVEASKLEGRWVDPQLGRIKFGELTARVNLRPSSRVRDETYLRRHLLPAFGRMPLNAIRRSDIQAWVRSLSDEKALAPRTVRECHRILGGIMREASMERLIPESPCQRAALPRIQHNERRFLAAPELELLAASMDERYSSMVYAGAYLGLRWGEIAGLKRTHVDFLR